MSNTENTYFFISQWFMKIYFFRIINILVTYQHSSGTILYRSLRFLCRSNDAWKSVYYYKIKLDENKYLFHRFKDFRYYSYYPNCAVNTVLTSAFQRIFQLLPCPYISIIYNVVINVYVCKFLGKIFKYITFLTII